MLLASVVPVSAIGVPMAVMPLTRISAGNFDVLALRR
jgi:hypothetical protein